MNEPALQYEYLIRRAFQCGRYGTAGANADTFRALERSFIINRDNQDPQKKDELLRNYAFYCGEVATYIVVALEKFTKDFDKQLTEIQNEELEEISSLLRYATIDEIEEVIVVSTNRPLNVGSSR